MAVTSIHSKPGEFLRYLIGLAIAGIVSYFTAVSAINERLAVVDTREQTRFEENQRTLARIERSVERMESDYRRTINEWANGIDRRTGEPLPLQRTIEGLP